MQSSAWSEAEARTLTLRRAARRDDGRVEAVMLLLNADGAGQDFTLPAPAQPWFLRLDSAEPDAPERALRPDEACLRVGARSLVLLSAEVA